MLSGRRETEIGEPPAVRNRPPRPSGIAAPLPQEKRLQAILRLRPHDDRIVASAHEVAHRLIRGIGDVNRAEFARAVEAGQRQTIAPIGFDPVAAPGASRTWSDTTVELASNYGLNAPRLNEAAKLIEEHLDEIRSAWAKRFPG